MTVDDRATPPKGLTREEAIDILAKALRDKMEHMDPDFGPEWDNMTDDDKHYYEMCIHSIIAHKEAMTVLSR